MPEREKRYFVPRTVEEVNQFNEDPARWAKNQLERAATNKEEPFLEVVTELFGLKQFNFVGAKRDHLLFLLFSVLYKLQEEMEMNQALIENLYDGQNDTPEDYFDKIDIILKELSV